MVIFINFFNHFKSSSYTTMDEDDNGKFRLARVKLLYINLQHISR